MTEAERREIRKNGPLAQCLRQLASEYTREELQRVASSVRAAAPAKRGGS